MSHTTPCHRHPPLTVTYRDRSGVTLVCEIGRGSSACLVVPHVSPSRRTSLSMSGDLARLAQSLSRVRPSPAMRSSLPDTPDTQSTPASPPTVLAPPSSSSRQGVLYQVYCQRNQVGEQGLVQGGGAGRWVCGVVKCVDGGVRYCGVHYAMCMTFAALRGMLRAVPYRVCQANIDLRCPCWYTWNVSLAVLLVCARVIVVNIVLRI
jgi:hypothetical protein